MVERKLRKKQNQNKQTDIHRTSQIINFFSKDPAEEANAQIL